VFQFSAWVLELLSGAIHKCKGVSYSQGTECRAGVCICQEKVEIPQHLTNLLAFSLTGSEWSKLIGEEPWH
jgi:hypothetical protein